MTLQNSLFKRFIPSSSASGEFKHRPANVFKFTSTLSHFRNQSTRVGYKNYVERKYRKDAENIEHLDGHCTMQTLDLIDGDRVSEMSNNYISFCGTALPSIGDGLIKLMRVT